MSCAQMAMLPPLLYLLLQEHFNLAFLSIPVTLWSGRCPDGPAFSLGLRRAPVSSRLDARKPSSTPSPSSLSSPSLMMTSMGGAAVTSFFALDLQWRLVRFSFSTWTVCAGTWCCAWKELSPKLLLLVVREP